MAEAAATDHRNGEAARGDDGRKDQRGFVADSAGGMFVHLFPGKIGEINDFARIKHRFGERRYLGATQAS
jgi:hypothetical protein